jgi:predicted DsbA family dithiol-disulfide isomerase
MTTETQQRQALEVELFTDFVCPWCYLGNAVLGKVSETVPLRIRRTPFPLHPDTPADGMKLSDLLRGMDLEAVHHRLYTLMDELGLEHGTRKHTYNTRLAQELVLWADSVKPDHGLDNLLYRAYFVHDHNLASPGVLLDLCTRAGLDQEAAQMVLQTRSFSSQVDEAWHRARQWGIRGVPAFVAGNLLASGFMPIPVFRKFLAQASDSPD